LASLLLLTKKPISMKKLVLAFIVFPIFLAAQAEKSAVSDSAWLTDYETAIKKASKEDKNILAYFTGSDWCPPCKMLKKDLFDTSEFQQISDDYVLLYIDIPMNKDLLSSEQLQHNKSVSAKLNKKGAVPLMKILDADGQELDSYSGYSMNGEVRYHMEILKKHQSGK